MVTAIRKTICLTIRISLELIPLNYIFLEEKVHIVRNE